MWRFGLIQGQHPSNSEHSEEAYFQETELPVLCLAIQLTLPELSQYCLYMILLIDLIGQVEEHVVKVANSEMVDIWPQAIIYVGFNGSRSIGHTEIDDTVFELTEPGTKCYLVPITYYILIG